MINETAKIHRQLAVGINSRLSNPEMGGGLDALR